MTDVERAREKISALFEEWLSLFGSDDLSFFERVLDDEWIYTDIFGKLRGKREYIEYLGRDVPETLTGSLIELTPQLHGNLALVTGRYTVDGTLADGTDVSSLSRFTAVWKETDAGWRALAHHATTIRAE